MIHIDITRDPQQEPVYRCYRGDDGGILYQGADLTAALETARDAARDRAGETVRVHPGRLDGLEIHTPGDQPVDFPAGELPATWPPAGSGETQFPPGPAWAVGADAGHRGPSGIGPGADDPGTPGEVDPLDAAGVIGGVMAAGREDDPAG